MTLSHTDSVFKDLLKVLGELRGYLFYVCCVLPRYEIHSYYLYVSGEQMVLLQEQRSREEFERNVYVLCADWTIQMLIACRSKCRCGAKN